MSGLSILLRILGAAFAFGLALLVTPLTNLVYIDAIIWLFCLSFAVLLPFGVLVIEKLKEEAKLLNIVSGAFIVAVLGIVVWTNIAHTQAGNIRETPVGPAATKTPTPTPTPTPPLGIDYDENNNGLIDITNVAQLQALRYDLFPTGTHRPTDRIAYEMAYPTPAPQMGCPTATGCIGYELRRDVNILGLAWVPIGPNPANPFEGRLEGNGFAIQDFVHDDATADSVGLFAYLGDNAIIENIKFTDSVVRGVNKVGTLAGQAGAARINQVEVVTESGVDAVTGRDRVGGLIGVTNGTRIKNVKYQGIVNSIGTPANRPYVGLLVGENISQYSTFENGICIGYAQYTYGSRGLTYVNGCLGRQGTSTVSITSLYYDSTRTAARVAQFGTNGRGPSSSQGVGQTTSALQTPVDYTDIYAGWGSRSGVGTGTGDEWDFGTATEYPELLEGRLPPLTPPTIPTPVPTPTPTPTPSPTPMAVDYDADNDRLIDVRNAAQLQAIRYDLFPNEIHVTPSDPAYATAFPNAMSDMGCPSTFCIGYELLNDISLRGVTWTPIGATSAAPFKGFLQGNGHTISMFSVSSSATSVGFFGYLNDAIVRNVKFTGVNVSGGDYVGTLVGRATSTQIDQVEAAGTVSGRFVDITAYIGGLVGSISQGQMTNVKFDGDVTTPPGLPSELTGRSYAGGLVGVNYSGVTSFTNGLCLGTHRAQQRNNSYYGGCIAVNSVGASVSSVYYDSTDVANQIATDRLTPRDPSSGTNGTGQTTTALRTPVNYTGVYACLLYTSPSPRD